MNFEWMTRIVWMTRNLLAENFRGLGNEFDLNQIKFYKNMMRICQLKIFLLPDKNLIRIKFDFNQIFLGLGKKFDLNQIKYKKTLPAHIR